MIALVLLGVLLWFCCKGDKRHRRDDDETMVSSINDLALTRQYGSYQSPKRGNVDLVESVPTVDPFPFGALSRTTATSPEMQEHSGSTSPTAFYGSSEGGYGQRPDVPRNPSSGASATGYDLRAGAYTGAGLSSGQGEDPEMEDHSNKRREAYQRSQSRRISNEASGSRYQPMSPSATSISGEDVTVHEDGGEYNLGREVPPTYVHSALA